MHSNISTLKLRRDMLNAADSRVGIWSWYWATDIPKIALDCLLLEPRSTTLAVFCQTECSGWQLSFFLGLFYQIFVTGARYDIHAWRKNSIVDLNVLNLTDVRVPTCLVNTLSFRTVLLLEISDSCLKIWVAHSSDILLWVDLWKLGFQLKHWTGAF